MSAKNKRRLIPQAGDYTYHMPQVELFEDVEIFAPISIKQEAYLNDQTNDIVVWGGAAGAGKTQLSLLKILLSAGYDRDYVGAVARRSQKQMKSAGSLWSTGTKMYSPMGVSSNSIELSWRFPVESEVKCHHLDNNQDDWQGTQCTEFLVDEAQQCKEDDVWYLTSRMRSRSKQKHQLRLTCNPLADSFLAEWLTKAGYLQEDGLPSPERDGVTTYMIMLAGEFHWYNTFGEMVELYGHDTAKKALKFVFYSATVYDNPYIRKNLPEYIFNLENLKALERSRLLLGNWYVREQGIGYLERDWFQEIGRSEVPLGLPTIRAWDLAATKPHQANKDPDYTRGVKATYDKNTGEFYIMDMVSIRDRAAIVQNLIEVTAQEDGDDCYVGIPIDAGQAGKVVADQKRAALLAQGKKVLLMSARKSKLERAEPFLIALQQRKVFLVRGVLDGGHLTELEAFDGKKNGGMHDDIMDAIADCYTQLTTGYLIPTIRMNPNSNRVRRLGGNTLL